MSSPKITTDSSLKIFHTLRQQLLSPPVSSPRQFSLSRSRRRQSIEPKTLRLALISVYSQKFL
ncbi:hypothetical protein Ahy_A07g031792 isoform E [Arachis hypogaea]|uniref:Uncharacterized protein n=1 Tax=Arachis hypogaea TaxID=3818 RepID=A0A445C539_ARAHY|nr:hypothetical protein Ahy_A07g031792 isoform E [Arachis hypogaea]